MRPTVGVLALQGDVADHLRHVERAGGSGVIVRRPEELDRCDALILPGGESTTIMKLATAFGLVGPLRDAISSGLPVFGTCAGLVLLADRLVDAPADQETLGGLDVSVRRNAFGRQVDSFETELTLVGWDDPVHATFIRAPWVEAVGPEVEVLATVGGHPVAVRQGNLLATSFHTELDEHSPLHVAFVAQAG